MEEKKQNHKKINRILKGIVVSNKMEKTIVVKVNSTRIHPTYKKRYTVSKKYKVHDPQEKYQTGDAVQIIQCRPFSKDKRWRVYQDK